MALIPREPFRDLESFFGEDDWFTADRQTPDMDVYETEDEIVTEVNAPGMNPENLSVNLDGDLLRIGGEMSEETKEEEQEKGYFRREIRKGSFERAIRLPAEVDEDEVEAVYEKGVLKVSVPKKEEEDKVEGKEIEIEER